MYQTQAYSRHMPAYPKHREPDPWPTEERARKLWEQMVAEEVAKLKRCWDKPRPHPAKVYYSACQVPGKNFCRLVNIPFDYVADLQRSWLYDKWGHSQQRYTQHVQVKPQQPRQPRGWFRSLLPSLLAGEL